MVAGAKQGVCFVSLPILMLCRYVPSSRSLSPNYVMRKSDNQDHLATAEVASLVFEQFGGQQEAEVLKHWFAAFRESYMLSKTRIAPDESRPQLGAYTQFIQQLP